MVKLTSDSLNDRVVRMVELMSNFTRHILCTLTDWLYFLCHLFVYFPPFAWVWSTLFIFTACWVLLWLRTLTSFIHRLYNHTIHTSKEFPQLFRNNYNRILRLNLPLLILRICILHSFHHLRLLPFCQQIINSWVFTKGIIRNKYFRASRNSLSIKLLLSSVTIDKTWIKPNCYSPLKKYDIDLEYVI